MSGLAIDIPGLGAFRFEHLVLDLNGTLALDGQPVGGVKEALEELAGALTLHLVTADTFGTAAGLFGPAVSLALIQKGDETAQKLKLVKSLGPKRTAAVGNGANDVDMLGAAAVGVAVLGGEGADSRALAAADVVVPGPLEALGLFLRPDRLRATLRR